MASLEFNITKQDILDGINAVINELSPAAGYMVQGILNTYSIIAGVVAPKLTGALAESNIYEMTGPMDGVMYPSIAYAPFVINPTPPHSIGSSVYMIGIGWRYIGLSPNGKGTIHPGTPGQDYMEDVFNLGDGAVDDEVDQFLDRIENAWSG
jgi:hypothetical protein